MASVVAWRPGDGRLRITGWLLVAFVVLALSRFAPAANPVADSATAAATRFLGKNSDSHLGALAWAATALVELKPGSPAPPLAAEAIQACHEFIQSASKGPGRSIDTLDLAGAIVFLTYFDPLGHRAEISQLTGLLLAGQQSHGGWGRQDGDVLQTTFAMLALWYVARRQADSGVDLAPVERAADWLVRTQDPRGGWSRYPSLASGSPLKLKSQTDMTPQRTAMALAALYLAGDLLQWVAPPSGAVDPSLPAVLKPVRGPDAPRAAARTADAGSFRAATRRGGAWLNKQFKADVSEEANEYFFAWEFYVSLRESAAARSAGEPKWYADIAKALKKRQQPDGSWDASQGRPAVVTTALACLALRRFGRSCVEEIRPVGEASLAPESALTTTGPSTAPDARKRPAPERSTPQRAATTDRATLRASALVGSVVSRAAALTELAQLDDLEDVDLFVQALSDDDWQIVLAADQALTIASRSLVASALPPEASAEARRAAVARWTDWRHAVRPDLE